MTVAQEPYLIGSGLEIAGFVEVHHEIIAGCVCLSYSLRKTHGFQSTLGNETILFTDCFREQCGTGRTAGLGHFVPARSLVGGFWHELISAHRRL